MTLAMIGKNRGDEKEDVKHQSKAHELKYPSNQNQKDAYLKPPSSG